MFLVAIDDFVLHGEVVVRVDRAFLGDQVADVSVRGQDLKVFAQIFFYGFGFCRRFYNDEILTHLRFKGKGKKVEGKKVKGSRCVVFNLEPFALCLVP